MIQTGLIKRVLEAMGIEGANSKATPADRDKLPAGKSGNTTEPTFNYASMIGML